MPSITPVTWSASLPSSTQLELFAVTAPGLESCLLAELQPLAERSRLVAGGVEIHGDLTTLYRLNLWSRLATRVLLRVGTVHALHFEELRRKTTALPWSGFARSAVRLRISATAHHCRLIHTGAISERVSLALGDAGVPVTTDESAPLLHVFVRGDQDHFTLSVDSSGELLHRRGYRLQDGGAPLRETLAPALLHLAGYLPSQTLCDPMCGAATLAIEAALLSLRRAPGIGRPFAFQDWPGFEPSRWQQLVDEARAGELSQLAQPILASDRDPQVLEIACRNAERAGVLPHLQLHCLDVHQLKLPSAAEGLILCNPPYGKRLRQPRLVETYRGLGSLLRRSPGFRLAILTTTPQLAQAAGPIGNVHWLRNGGLRVGLFSVGKPQREATATLSSAS